VARRIKRRPRAKTRLRRSRVQSAVGTAAGQSTAIAVSKSTRKRGQYKKREQKLILALVDKKWPGASWEHLSTSVLMKALEPEFKNRGLPFPERNRFLRALGRREG
jgi:hypothetical protein